jgi:uncharacterized protein
MTSVPPPFEHPGPPPQRPELPEGVHRPEPAPPPAPPVPLWTPLVGLLIAFVCATLSFVLISAAVEAGGVQVDPEDPPDGVEIAATAVQDVALIAGAYWLVRLYAGRIRGEWFGFRRSPLLSSIGWMIVAYLMFWTATVLVLSAFGPPEQQDLARELESETAVGVLVGYGLLTCFVAPIAEEVFFRGFMFQVFARRIGVVWGAIVTGGVFGLIHITGSPIESVIVLVAFGIALCFLFVRTGSLIPCIVLHAINNSISFAVTTDLPPWGFPAILVGSCGAVLLVSRTVTARVEHEGAT